MCQTLFDVLERADHRPIQSRESLFTHYNRRAGEEFESARSILEDWLTLVADNDAKRDLVRRFRSGNNEQFHSVIFELYLMNRFIEEGYEVEVHPTTESAQETTPDFLVRSALGEEFYLEATVILNACGLESNPIIDHFILDLDARAHSDFLIDLDYSGEPTQTPSSARAAREIHRWLDTLDRAQCRQILSDDVEALPRMKWEDRGLLLDVVAIPRPSRIADTANDRLIGIGSLEGGVLDTRTSVFRKLNSKASHYGALEKPLIIAVHTIELYDRDNEDNLDILFGTLTTNMRSGRVFRSNDGFWSNRNGRLTKAGVTGVWMVNRLNIHTLNQVNSLLCLCPQPDQLPPRSLLNYNHCIVIDGVIQQRGEIML